MAWASVVDPLAGELGASRVRVFCTAVSWGGLISCGVVRFQSVARLKLGEIGQLPVNIHLIRILK